MFLLQGVDPDDRNPEEQSVERPVNVGPSGRGIAELRERS